MPAWAYVWVPLTTNVSPTFVAASDSCAVLSPQSTVTAKSPATAAGLASRNVPIVPCTGSVSVPLMTAGSGVSGASVIVAVPPVMTGGPWWSSSVTRIVNRPISG